MTVSCATPCSCCVVPVSAVPLSPHASVRRAADTPALRDGCSGSFVSTTDRDRERQDSRPAQQSHSSGSRAGPNVHSGDRRLTPLPTLGVEGEHTSFDRDASGGMGEVVGRTSQGGRASGTRRARGAGRSREARRAALRRRGSTRWGSSRPRSCPPRVPGERRHRVGVPPQAPVAGIAGRFFCRACQTCGRSPPPLPTAPPPHPATSAETGTTRSSSLTEPAQLSSAT